MNVQRHDIDQRIDSVTASAAKAINNLKVAVNDAGDEPLQVLHQIKFEQIGCEPLDSEQSLNFVEQVNQTFTCLVSFYAARWLFERHKTLHELSMNLGYHNGPDIEGSWEDDGGVITHVAAEVFAAVHPDNNRKLSKDVARVRGAAAEHRYVFFHSPGNWAEVRERDGVQIVFINL